MSTQFALRFLGVGSAGAVELGASSVMLERDGAPRLMVDCGQEALSACLERYGEPPPAMFITHVHMDHVAGMERLFVRCWFDEGWRGRMKLFVPAGVVPWLQGRVADYPGVLAEGGVNFWDAFQVIPVSRGFWFDQLWFETLATRHHQPGTSFGLRLPGSFVFTGDTRPVPERLEGVGEDELIAHDCGLIGNPSHTGLDDVEREYPEALRRRLVLYHYGSAADGEAMRARGYHVARPGELFGLAPPIPAVTP